MNNEDKLGLVLNTLVADPIRMIPAFSQYLGLTFNSLCVLDGEIVGANDDGLFTMTGKKDNEENIDAHVKIGPHDFGSENEKRFLAFIFGCRLNGSVELEHSADEATSGKKFLSSVINPREYEKFENIQSRASHVVEGRYHSLKIKNVDGSRFKIDEVIGFPTLMDYAAR